MSNYCTVAIKLPGPVINQLGRSLMEYFRGSRYSHGLSLGRDVGGPWRANGETLFRGEIHRKTSNPGNTNSNLSVCRMSNVRERRRLRDIRRNARSKRGDEEFARMLARSVYF